MDDRVSIRTPFATTKTILKILLILLRQAIAGGDGWSKKKAFCSLKPHFSVSALPTEADPLISPVRVSSRSGGIGRRAGFKIRFPQGSVGSTPTFGTSSLDQMKLGGQSRNESPTFGGGVAKRSNASDCKSDDFGLRRFESFPRHHLFLLLLLLLLVIIIKYVMFSTKVAKYAKIFCWFQLVPILIYPEC